MRSKTPLILVVALLLLAGLFVHRQRSRSPRVRERRLETAAELVRAGDEAAAVDLLRELAVRPESSPEAAEAALLLARTLTRTGDDASAAGVWSSLAALDDPGVREEAVFHLALIAARTGEPEQLESFISRFPASPWTPEARLARARLRREAGDREGAEEDYRGVIASTGPAPVRSAAREELGELNLEWFFSRETGPGISSYRVRSGDSLGAIAVRHGTTADLIRKMNRLPGDTIHPGQNLRIPAERFSAVVSKTENNLILLYGGEFFKEYPVGTGRDGISPVGEFTIVTKLIDPPWFHRGEVIPPFDERNILGTRWMGFQDPYAAYGIHGTTQPETVGTQSSDGCVRMRNPDVEELFIFLPRGARVVIEE